MKGKIKILVEDDLHVNSSIVDGDEDTHNAISETLELLGYGCDDEYDEGDAYVRAYSNGETRVTLYLL